MPPMPLPPGLGGLGVLGKGKGKGKGLDDGKGGKAMGGLKGKGGKGKGLAKLRVPQGPPSKTKGVFWNTLSDQAAAYSVWGQVDASDASGDFDVDDIEKQFAKKKSAKPKNSEEVAKSARKEKVSIIDANRSRNIEIMLSTIKLTNADIQGALVSYDKNNFFTQSQIQSLSKYIPTDADKKKLQAYDGEDSKLGKADLFMREIASVPRLLQRLQVLSVKTSFEPDAANLRKLIGVVSNASNQIKSSKKLAKVLEYILALGNHLNKGTNRGQATGFKLDGLIKFTETKGVDQSTTLLHYLCSTVSTKSPELLTFPEDLAQVKQASKMTFGLMTSQYQDLIKAAEQLETEVPYAPPDAGIAEVAVKARDTVTEIGSSIEQMNAWIVDVAQYFGESGHSGEPEAAFQIMDQFVESFLKARSDVEKAKQLKEERAKRAAAREKQKKEKPKKEELPDK